MAVFSIVYDDFSSVTTSRCGSTRPVVAGSWNVDWQAFMAVGGLEIQERIDPGDGDEPIPVYRVDGQLFIEDYQSFFGTNSTGFSVPLTITELETEPTFRAWTGSLADGRPGFAPNGDPFTRVTVGSTVGRSPSSFFNAGWAGTNRQSVIGCLCDLRNPDGSRALVVVASDTLVCVNHYSLAAPAEPTKSSPIRPSRASRSLMSVLCSSSAS